MTVHLNSAGDAVADVLAELPGDWTTTQDYDHGVTAARLEDGLQLWFGFGYRPDDDPAMKAEVHLMVARDHLRYDETVRRVNVSLARGAGVVARDLQRRLMPDAEAMHALILERAAEHDAYEARVSAGRSQLLEVAGVTAHGSDVHRAHVMIGDVYGDVTVRDGCANLELRGVSVADVRALLERIAGGAA